jgi:chromosome segregation ATPase
VSEKERELADKERGKAKKRISDLRGTISSLQERTRTREEELMRDLSEEQKKVAQLSVDLEQFRRIREELMQVIVGGAADTEYLKSKLSEREMKQVLDQMTAKQDEEKRPPEVQRRSRQESFGKKSPNTQ